MLRTHVNEMNVESVDLGDEVWQCLQSRLTLTPVVICSPIAREFLHRRELHALCCVVDGFLLGPLRRVDASPQIADFRFRKVHLKRPYRVCLNCRLCRTCLGHSYSPLGVDVCPCVLEDDY